ncbi:MAG: hypothetical protein M3Q03_17020 [Chloroflexota bacterium]|nr:hypothetical protein [Chloroflexota bacterium]
MDRKAGTGLHPVPEELGAPRGHSSNRSSDQRRGLGALHRDQLPWALARPCCTDDLRPAALRGAGSPFALWARSDTPGIGVGLAGSFLEDLIRFLGGSAGDGVDWVSSVPLRQKADTILAHNDVSWSVAPPSNLTGAWRAAGFFDLYIIAFLVLALCIFRP